MSPRKTRGFTLLELIIVIAILAILSVAVILVINPAETLRRGRDSTRLSDLAAVKSAIALGLTENANLDLNGLGADTDVWTSRPTASITDPSVCGSGAAPRAYTGAAGSVDGTGWIPANLSTGFGTGWSPPLSNYPIDPTNTVAVPGGVTENDYMYLYRPSGTTFELNTNMESALYKTSGTQDQETNDGGNNVNIYESGTSLTVCNVW